MLRTWRTSPCAARLMAIPSRPARPVPADAVYIIFHLARQVEVDYVADARYVDTACGDVGGDQYLTWPRRSSVQGAIAFALRHVTMQGAGDEALCRQAVCQIVGGAFGRSEYHGLVRIAASRSSASSRRFLWTEIVGVHQLLGDFRFGFSAAAISMRVAL